MLISTMPVWLLLLLVQTHSSDTSYRMTWQMALTVVWGSDWKKSNSLMRRDNAPRSFGDRLPGGHVQACLNNFVLLMLATTSSDNNRACCSRAVMLRAGCNKASTGCIL